VMVLAAVLAIVSIGGVVLAQENEEDSPAAKFGEFMERICEIYEDNTGTAIDSEELQKAFTQAQSEMQAAAMEARLAKMVENGVIDETQAQELKDWWESRPEDLPFGPGLMAPGGERPFGGPGGRFHGGDRLPPMPVE
ncbi:unnamed protein product, partial [marine sediment metagenome]